MQNYLLLFLVLLIFFIFFLYLSLFDYSKKIDLQSRIKRVMLNKKIPKKSLSFQKKRESKTLRFDGEEKNIANIVEKLDLRKLFVDEAVIDSLTIAGYRRKKHITIFLFSRLIGVFVSSLIGIIIVFGFGIFSESLLYQLLTIVVFSYVGFYFPVFFVRHKAKSRKRSINMFYPDALDLMLICIESGLSFELTIKKVAEEIRTQSIALAEELELLSVELSFLDERKKAYDNFSRRIGIKAVKSTSLALIQAEQYGTPMGNVLRVLSNELRELRELEAEKKAAALPPKLTVPMIIFFVPIIFSIIIGPVYIKVMQTTNLFN